VVAFVGGVTASPKTTVCSIREKGTQHSGYRKSWEAGTGREVGGPSILWGDSLKRLEKGTLEE